MTDPQYPPADPDRLVKGFVGVIVVGLAMSWLTAVLGTTSWAAAIPPILLVVALLVAVPRTGLLRPERHGGARWTVLVAGLLLIGYLGVAVYGATREWSWQVTLASLACLWGASVLVTWHTLTADRTLDAAAGGVASLLPREPPYAAVIHCHALNGNGSVGSRLA